MRSARRSLITGASIFAGFAAIVLACNTPHGGAYQATRDRSNVMDAEVSGAGSGAATFPVKPTSELNLVASIPNGGDWMCFGFGSLWEPGGGGIARIDPVTHKVITKIAQATGNFCYPAPDSNTMWVASVFDGTLYRIDADANTVTGTFKVEITSGSEASFAVSQGGVWVVTSHGNTQSGTLTRVDPTDGHVIADITIPNGSAGIVAGGNFIWVSNPQANSVTQVDPATNAVVKQIPTDAGPRFIGYGEGAVWTLCQGTGRLARIDPVTGTLVTHIDVKNPGFGGDVAAGEGGVWTTTFGRPVTHVDPNTNTVVEAFEGSGFGDAIRTGGGYVWVSGGQLHQIKFATGGGSGSGSGAGSSSGSASGSESGSDTGGGVTEDPLVPPPGAKAKSVKIYACGNNMFCSHLAAPNQLGCVATDGANIFKAMGGQNNTCAMIGLRKQICDGNLAPTNFKAACFTKI